MSYIRLESNVTSLVLDVSSGRIPRIIYWGSRLNEHVNFEQLAAIHEKPVLQAGLDTPYRMNAFPEQGIGFKGRPALIGHRNQKNWSNLFEIKNTDHDKSAAKIVLEDKNANLELILELQLEPNSDVLAQRTCIKNLSSTPYQIDHCAGAVIQLPEYFEELLTFHGCWTGEFKTEKQRLLPGISSFENRTGRTSHESFPGIIAGTKGFAENSGPVIGVHLGWSGNHSVLVEQLPDGCKQVQVGELITPGEIVLEKDKTYQSPWAYSGYSHSGLNGLSEKFHTYVRNQIIPDQVISKPRPVQFNSWEAVYFDHDIDQLKSLASKAAKLGVERFVLDDGWFHKRGDDSRALGDWWPDETKYPQGLSPLVDHVKSQGMEFGLWVEPEMVNPDSELFKTHPDWVLSIEGIPLQTSRNQLVLNLCNSEVFTYLYKRLDSLLAEYDIRYLKWDMNRTFTSAGNQGNPAYHNQTHALYNLLDKLRSNYPDVELETCASGGGRVDYEILKRTHRFWASDSNDPLQRQKIQKGASLFFPPEITGSHIGPAECHTSGRTTTLAFRAMSSLFYHFGCEFDLNELNSTEEVELIEYIKIHKKYRTLFHQGRYVRLDLDVSLRNGFGSISKDQSMALFCITQMDAPQHNDNSAIRFAGLSEQKTYRLKLLQPLDKSITGRMANTKSWVEGMELPGNVLMEHGIKLFTPWPQTSILVELVEVGSSKS